MLIDERRQSILKWIMEEEYLTLEDLAKRLNVSLMTVRRDLGRLQQQGFVKRVRGGAVKVLTEPVYQIKSNSRKKIHYEEKQKIARYAVEHFVSDREIIIMEGGTTVSAMGPHLNIENLTVLTNGLNVVNVAASFTPRIELICSGGHYLEKEFVFVGSEAESVISSYRATRCFFGGDGLTIEDGLLEWNMPVIGVKRAMIGSAQQNILLIDSSKFGVSSLLPAIPLADIDVIVTDTGAPADFVEALRSHGVDVHIAK